QKWNSPALFGPLFSRLGSVHFKGEEKRILLKTLLDDHFRLSVTKGLKGMGKRTSVTAPLVGGNLAVMVASLGTPWEIDTKNKIFLIEEVGERAYRIERMLFQLRCAGKFDHVKGIIVTQFTKCTEPDGRSLWQTSIRRNFENSPFPVITG